MQADVHFKRFSLILVGARYRNRRGENEEALKEKKCPSKAVVGDEGKDSFGAKEEGRRKVETKSRAAVLAVRLRGEKKDGERGRFLFHFEVENFRKRARKEKGKEKRGRPHSSTSDFFAHLSSSMPSAKS